jgi:hypothetical protein
VNPQPNPIVVRAASYLGIAGFGNHRTGLVSWPPAVRFALEQGNVEAVHWSHLFLSDPQRFARMDPLCRVGLMAVELLEAGFESMDQSLRLKVGLAAETAGGCVTTDARFLQTPRPSLFTYTLPSTVLGEVSIRYHLQGPMLCLLTSDGEGRPILEEATDWLRTGMAELVICLCCEAVAGAVASRLSLSGSWGAHAVLLARAEDGPRLDASQGSSVRMLTRHLCIDNPGASLHAGPGISTSR